MRFKSFCFALVAMLFSTPGLAQVTQWVDQNGVVHYQATGPKEPGNRNLPQPKPNAHRPIDRNHGGLRLGDDETPFIAAKKGVFVGNSGSDGNYYRYAGTLPEGAINMGLLFGAGRLAFMIIEYRDFGLGGWEQLVKQTVKAYGPALGDTRTAVWNDGATQLTLEHESNGNVTVTLEDFAAMSRYSEQERAALPKF